VSGLYGHSLSEAKEHWKGSSNGQSSFARNPEATASWLALLKEHPPRNRLRPIVNFLPELLVTTRLDRPTAQEIVNTLETMSQYIPDPPHLSNTCCSTLGIRYTPSPEPIQGSGLYETPELLL
jgi:hypothetical protein